MRLLLVSILIIFSVGYVKPYKVESLGCWEDKGKRAIGVQGSHTEPSSKDTALSECAERALRLGFTVFGVENVWECYTAENADRDETYKQYGKSDKCKDEGRGGPWALSVYKITDSEECNEEDCAKRGANAACGKPGWNEPPSQCTCKEGFVLNESNNTCDPWTDDIDCYTGGYGKNYRGTVNTTKHGEPCVYWSDKKSADHKLKYGGSKYAGNYCRGTYGYTPWCFHVGGREWDLCDVPECLNQGCNDADCNKKQANTFCLKSDSDKKGRCVCKRGYKLNTDTNKCHPTKWVPGIDCYTGSYGVNYRGDVAKTISGEICTPWKEKNSAEFSDTSKFSKNNCRGTFDGINGRAPWCHYEGGVGWGECDVPKCPNQDWVNDIDCYTSYYGLDYRGKVATTRSGETCDKWEDSKEAQYSDRSKWSGNYCRGKYGQGPWCFHSGGKGWAYCDVPPCPNQDECSDEKCNAKHANTHCSERDNGWTRTQPRSHCQCKPGFQWNVITNNCDMCGYEKGPEPSKWCKLTCANTMCIYPGPNPSCDIFAYGGFTNMTEAEKKSILDTINKYRKRIARGIPFPGEGKGNKIRLPAAEEPMPDLKWDDDMAEIAQRWATQCVIAKHDTSGRYTPKFGYTGQNAYAGRSPVKPQFSRGNQPSDVMSVAVTSWYNEVNKFIKAKCDHKRYGHCEEPIDGTIAHFTAVVWQSTTHVGCGYAWYKDENGMYQSNVYCNFAPNGNHDSAVIWQ